MKSSQRADAGDGFSIRKFSLFLSTTKLLHFTDPMAEDEKKDEQQQRVSRHKLSVTQKTQQQLEKMFSRIDKPVNIPEPPKEKSIKPPKDFVRNVPGIWKKEDNGDRIWSVKYRF